MMFLWRIWLTARASATNRCTIAGSDEYCRFRTLMATCLPMSGCSARKTEPKPPSPILSETTYSPTLSPGSRSASAAPMCGMEPSSVVVMAEYSPSDPVPGTAASFAPAIFPCAHRLVKAAHNVMRCVWE